MKGLAAVPRTLRRRLLLTGMVLAVGLLSLSAWEATRRARPRPLPVVGRVPDFRLTSQTGRPVGLEDLAGEVWIADFVFTRCAGPCPKMTMGMKEIQDDLRGVSGLRFVTITVDPDHDTPEVLRSYAQSFGADTGTWIFLTGGGREIRDLARNGFHLGSPPAQGLNGAIGHSVYFVLVDGRGRIRGYYEGTDGEARGRLARDARRLAREG